MSVLGHAVIIGRDGETASIVLTVPHGAANVSCTSPGGITLTGTTIPGEINDVYTFSYLRTYGNYTCSATYAGTIQTPIVKVDSARVFSAYWQ